MQEFTKVDESQPCELHVTLMKQLLFGFEKNPWLVGIRLLPSLSKKTIQQLPLQCLVGQVPPIHPANVTR